MANKVTFNENYPVITESDRIYSQAVGLIPGATQTLAKGPGQYVKGIAPKYLVKGKGSHVWDADGNEYIDYNMGIGPLSLGYCYEKTDMAIAEQLKSGITFSQMHPLEVEVAQLINKIVPNAEMVRFSKTGADVASAAIRLARAYTGKNSILCCGYHGWHDWYISVTDRAAGIPEAVKNMTFTFNYNDIESVIDSIDDDTAAVILEPVVFQEEKKSFLSELRRVCDEKNILLIFDEMWTGFRIALGGAQEYFNVKADIALFSKAVANGMPLSIITGRKDIMKLLEKEVFFFTTFGGETLSLAAAKATIEEMIDKNVPRYLNEKGEYLKKEFNSMTEQLSLDFVSCNGYGFRTVVTFDDKKCDSVYMKSVLQQELIKNGILWSGFHNMSFSHSDEDIEYTLSVYRHLFPFLKKVKEDYGKKSYLLGEQIEPVFRRIGNFNMKPKNKV